jgi:hypothetical protein
VEEVAVKFVIAPLVMVTSVSIKSLVAALAVKVSAIEASFVVLPEDTVEEAIVIVGDMLSTSKVALGSTPRYEGFPPESVAVPGPMEMERVPSPVMELMVTVRAVNPDPDTPMVPVAFPVWFRVTSPAASVMAEALVYVMVNSTGPEFVIVGEGADIDTDGPGKPVFVIRILLELFKFPKTRSRSPSLSKSPTATEVVCPVPIDWIILVKLPDPSFAQIRFGSDEE